MKAPYEWSDRPGLIRGLCRPGDVFMHAAFGRGMKDPAIRALILAAASPRTRRLIQLQDMRARLARLGIKAG